MDNEKMVEDLVKMLDSGMAMGVGHVNVDYDETKDDTKNVQTMGCTDCSRTPLACSVPTLEDGLDDFH
ncbi:hypothetical protein D5282_18910 [bacterium 1xD8-48]|jgi:hypothetical protein|nr:hypothetical protein [Lachnospiraceae bacterium]MCI9326521.1 hypothetical protein [Lachnospiraceae bacterium]MDE6964694.1 hypothetical protein [Lachnospiraceae bacterium]NBJ99315.1 hypothetical protein [bacterium 1xD8-48]